MLPDCPEGRSRGRRAIAAFLLVLVVVASLLASSIVMAVGIWTQKADMPTPRGALGVVAHPNGKIYAIGGGVAGSDTAQPVGTVEEYDPQSNGWTTRAPMPTPRMSFGVALTGTGMIYAIGGYASQGPTTALEVYDALTDTWVASASAPGARWGLAAAEAGGKIYAIGGIVPGGALLSWVQEYDPNANVWTSVASMPTARYFPGAVTGCNDKVYVIGGRASGPSGPAPSRAVEEYDPVANAWVTRANMPTPREGLAVTRLPDCKILAAGGAQQSGAAVLATVEIYDPQTDTWATADSMPTARYVPGAATAANGKAYVMGGTHGRVLFATVEEYVRSLATPGVTISESDGSTQVIEGGETDTYTVVLASQPSADVTITAYPGTQVTVRPSTLTFTASNWDAPQVVTVSAVPDGLAEGPHTGAVEHRAASADPDYNGIAVPRVTVSISEAAPAPIPSASSAALVLLTIAFTVFLGLRAITAWRLRSSSE
ncbi:MAG: hypothetical protein HY683_04070 [Chloroflexi bacterium]|nr:hypothetical protein [Chloroflexota bacterium]